MDFKPERATALNYGQRARFLRLHSGHVQALTHLAYVLEK